MIFFIHYFQFSLINYHEIDFIHMCTSIYTFFKFFQVMELAIAEPFVAPVDLNVYPTYAYVVEYPIDLSTIKVY